MIEPISSLTAIASTFKFAEFCFNYGQVDADNHAFLALITRVRQDLDEALRERREKETIVKALSQGKRAWIDGTIVDTQSALNAIGILIESARIDLEQDGVVNMKHRFEWVLGNHHKFLSRELRLATCHRSLIEAINVMHNLQAATSFGSPPENHPSLRLEQELIDDDPPIPRGPLQRRSRKALIDDDSPIPKDSLQIRPKQELIDDDPPIPRGPSQRRPKRTGAKADQSPVTTPLDEANIFRPPPLFSYASDRHIDLEQLHGPHPIDPHNPSSDFSPPASHPSQSPSDPSAPVLPEIPKYSFCFEGYMLTDDPDGAKALSAAADALDAQGPGLSNIALVPASRPFSGDVRAQGAEREPGATRDTRTRLNPG